MIGITIPAALELAAKALTVEELRAESVRLHAERNGLQCEVEPVRDDDPPGPWDRGPCWKAYEESDFDHAERVAQDRWCQPCLDREAVHLQYRDARRRLGRARGRLQRACARQLRAIAAQREQAS